MVEFVSDIDRCSVAIAALDQGALDFQQLLTRLEQMNAGAGSAGGVGIDGKGMANGSSRVGKKQSIAFPTRKSSPSSQRSKVVQQLEELEQVRASLPASSAWRKPLKDASKMKGDSSTPPSSAMSMSRKQATQRSGSTTPTAKTPSPRVRVSNYRSFFVLRY